ncbi:MAG: hypothetical protein HC882_07625 [Acidobacteria bacterium]|nr:hypothetical protein [Acidobacteriota bacterium]
MKFYDYTKNFKRMERFLSDPWWYPNYHLTFSRSEKNEDECRKVLAMGGNVSTVLRGQAELLRRFGPKISAVDGDAHDLTFLHPPGSVLVLKAKGAARRDTTGFVLD